MTIAPPGPRAAAAFPARRDTDPSARAALLSVIPVDGEDGAPAVANGTGHERSGFGRTMGADSVLDHTRVKAVSLGGTG